MGSFTEGMNRRIRSRLSESVGKANFYIRECYEKSATALLRKGESRLWTNMFVRERLSPFLKPRPTDAFRNILLLKYSPDR